MNDESINLTDEEVNFINTELKLKTIYEERDYWKTKYNKYVANHRPLDGELQTLKSEICDIIHNLNEQIQYDILRMPLNYNIGLLISTRDSLRLLISS